MGVGEQHRNQGTDWYTDRVKWIHTRVPNRCMHPRSLPSCPASPGKPSRSCVSKFTTHIPEIYHFLSHTCAYLFRHPESAIRRPLSSSPILQKVCFPGIHVARYIFNSAVLSHGDFIQDPYLKELKVHKPAPKVPRPVSSPAPRSPNSF